MIKIICLGKIKEKYLNDLIDDYKKRINKYHKLEIIELKDENNLVNESKAILNQLKTKDYIITLDIEGKLVSSTEFAGFMNDWFMQGGNIIFIIGSSEGLDESIKKISNFSLSFSKMTFPHGLFRGILLEQIYRSFKINNNETYHK